MFVSSQRSPLTALLRKAATEKVEGLQEIPDLCFDTKLTSRYATPPLVTVAMSKLSELAWS